MLNAMRPLIRGVSLMEALIALGVLSFGLMAMTRLQARQVAFATDAQSRQSATQFSSELMSLVRVDPAQVRCYTVPADAACTNAPVAALAAAWATRVNSGLPGPVATTSLYDATTGRLTVRIQWQGKGSIETRQTEVATDVRP
jgi:type IV pilus assembly protein PilV